MSSLTLTSYIYELAQSWEDHDGHRCAELMSIQDAHFRNDRIQSEVVDYDSSEQLVSAFNVKKPLSDLLSLHFKVMMALSSTPTSLTAAFKFQSNLVTNFGKFLQTQARDNWACPILEKICRDLRYIAIKAAQEEPQILSSDENTPTLLEKAADSLVAIFRICAGDTGPPEATSKRLSLMSLVNNLFIIYFRINRLNLCRPLIRAIEALQGSFMKKFPREQMVTYKYYVGKKAMFDSEFKTADNCLEYAFRHASTQLNKRKILMYLIPVKMFLGTLPTTEALVKYNLLQFQPVAESLREGNVKKFNDSLRDSGKEFITAGVYLILQKLQTMLFRNLVKKCSLLTESHHLPIKMIEAALRWSGYDEITNDETHCILANLIFAGSIKGYISYPHQVLVVAKSNAFPPVNGN